MPIRVLASVIEREDRILVCKRPAHKRHGGLWEFPGGKVEGNETNFQTVQRELDEELGVAVIGVGPTLFSMADPGSEFLIEFVLVQIAGDPQPVEHEMVLWATADELLSLKLAPTDLRFAHFRAQQR